MCRRQRVTDRGPVDILDAGNDISDFASSQPVAVFHFGRERPNTIGRVRAGRRHDFDLAALAETAIDNAHKRYNTDIIIKPRINDQCLQWRIHIAFRRRNSLDNGVEQFRYAIPGLGADPNGILSVNADDILDLRNHLVRVCRRQVDLVQYREDFEALVNRRRAVGDALGLNALRCIDHQQCAFAGSQATRHLIRKVNVAGRVDQVQLVALTVRGLVAERHTLCLDCNSAFPLEIH